MTAFMNNIYLICMCLFGQSCKHARRLYIPEVDLHVGRRYCMSFYVRLLISIKPMAGCLAVS